MNSNLLVVDFTSFWHEVHMVSQSSIGCRVTFDRAPTAVEMQMATSSYEDSSRPPKSNISNKNPALSLFDRESESKRERHSKAKLDIIVRRRDRSRSRTRYCFHFAYKIDDRLYNVGNTIYWLQGCQAETAAVDRDQQLLKLKGDIIRSVAGNMKDTVSLTLDAPGKPNIENIPGTRSTCCPIYV